MPIQAYSGGSGHDFGVFGLIFQGFWPGFGPIQPYLGLFLGFWARFGGI